MEYENLPTIPMAKPLVETKRAACEQIYDVEGSLWEVRATRATEHGFNLYLGFPAEPPFLAAGRPCFIMTPELAEYLRTHRIEEEGMYSLPASRGAIQKMRRMLGFNFMVDRRALWYSRLPDLRNLTPRQFAARYNVPKYLAQLWRSRLTGPGRRLPDWWRDPAVLRVLRSDARVKEIARKLGISSTHAGRLRAKCR